MTASEVYEMYVALKAHFQGTYDFHKYGGKLSDNVRRSLKGKGFEHDCRSISKMKDPFGFLLANIFHNQDWVPTMRKDGRSRTIYNAFKKRWDGFTYNFTQDLRRLSHDIDAELQVKPGDMPPLMRRWMMGEVSPETVAVIATMLGAWKAWKDELTRETSPFKDSPERLFRYESFLVYDKKVVKSALREHFATPADAK